MQNKSTHEKSLYYFFPHQVEGSSSLLNVLGSKGVHLAEMISMGFPVPPGFTISTLLCQEFYKNDKKLPESLKKEIVKAMKALGQEMASEFGNNKNPLLVSVRSGARISMPGMMDSILNLGLNDESVKTLAEKSSDERFAWDCYRRFIQMYSDVVLSVDSSLLVFFLEDVKNLKNYKKDSELKVEDLKKIISCFKEQVLQTTGHHFPQDPWEQMYSAVSAVFNSWNNPRAISYRELHNYSHSWGTAVSVQAMVFGNKGNDCATGVAFTRDPSSGEKRLVGEFLTNAQGEDVVAGVRTPFPITKLMANGKVEQTLEERFPSVFEDLSHICEKLEAHYKDVQDIEFTVEKGQLWILQTRNAKRTAKAALRVALDMLDEGLITEQEVLFRVQPSAIENLLHPCLDPKSQKVKIAQGLAASPGGVSGCVVFSSEEALEYKNRGKKTILLRLETSPDDIKGMIAAEGILTSRGGITSHAAVVARGMGKCCIVGCHELELSHSQAKVGQYVIQRGDEISLDGATGEVFLGTVPTLEPQLDEAFQRFMSIVEKFSDMKVRANADHPREAEMARHFGAQGIGLCRTEHMFFGSNRILSVRKMILASKESERKQALQELLPMQRDDFCRLFSVMKGLPVTIRLLDPPLHEFLPQGDKEIDQLAKSMGESREIIRSRVESLKEVNPMLGHRGCRLAISYPEIYQMQVRAIAEAVYERMKEGETPIPEIMIPLVMMESELKFLVKLVKKEIQSVQSEKDQKFQYMIGTMIELPRAALVADELAIHVDFFSFGTNDLTQTTLGISRDDCGKFLPSYMSEELLSEDPFARVDRKGVGFLIQRAVELGRSQKKQIKLGICGEHGADLESIYFFDKLGLDYVSCSAYRVPVARLVTARSAIEKRKKKIENES